MSPLTRKLLQDLESLNWFHAVGQPIPDLPQIKVLSNWKEAVRSSKLARWREMQIEAHNHLTFAIYQIAPKRYEEWNSIVDDIKPIIVRLVAIKTANVVKDHRLPKSLIDYMEWDLVGAAIETEYYDIFQDGFFYALFQMTFARGHLPCGWVGKVGDGNLVVY